MGAVDRLDGISRRGRRARCISLLVLILFSPGCSPGEQSTYVTANFFKSGFVHLRSRTCGRLFTHSFYLPRREQSPRKKRGGGFHAPPKKKKGEGNFNYALVSVKWNLHM